MNPLPKIVVIDTDPRFRGLFEEALTDSYAVEPHNAGQAGLASCRQAPPDAVVVDLESARTERMFLLGALGAASGMAKVPVIVWTSGGLDGQTRARLEGHPNVRAVVDKIAGWRALRAALGAALPRAD